MKKLISLMLSAAMIATACIAGSVTVFAAVKGSGTETDPYVVSDGGELRDTIRKAPTGNKDGTPTYFRIDSDINYNYSIPIESGRNIALDLNQHCICANSISVKGSKLYIENGTVTSIDSRSYYASPALQALENAVLTAKGVTFHSGNGLTDDTAAGYGVQIDNSEFKITGCTIISGNSGNNSSYASALYVSSNSSGKIYDTTLIRGSGKTNDNKSHYVLYVANGCVVIDGAGNRCDSDNTNNNYFPPRSTKIDQADGTGVVKALGTYKAASSPAIVYSVDIAWGDMVFTYTDANEGTWNPENHTFENQTDAIWACTADANKITVTNHSNTAIGATLSYSSEIAHSAISGSFTDKGGTAISNSLLRLATAEDTTVDNAPKAEAFLKLDGALSKSTTTTKIGSVTVTISDRD